MRGNHAIHTDLPPIYQNCNIIGMRKRIPALLKSFDEIQDILYENGIEKQYRNYPSLGFNDWEKAYFGDGYKRLQEIKRKYDPENLFEHEQSVRLG